MTDVPDNMFEVLGDPEALSDEFFDSLAGLLLSIVQREHAGVEVNESGAMQAAPDQSMPQRAVAEKVG